MKSINYPYLAVNDEITVMFIEPNTGTCVATEDNSIAMVGEFQDSWVEENFTPLYTDK